MTEQALKERALEEIKKVYDPEIPVNVFDLGLIYEVSVYPVNNVFVLMTLTSPACPSAQSLPEEIKNKIEAIEGVGEVNVEVTFDPPYSQEMMSETAKFELGFL
ncbi:MAG TPA: FeS assembly SUF system protein [Cytophagales bacterium]|nr:FeS assembly SUF system protein [Cytophagales bacterium]